MLATVSLRANSSRKRTDFFLSPAPQGFHLGGNSRLLLFELLGHILPAAETLHRALLHPGQRRIAAIFVFGRQAFHGAFSFRVL